MQGGPWAILLLCVGAFVLALSRGYLVRGSELERAERRMEKDTDRVLALYVKQIDGLLASTLRKDETIAKQDEQIAKLLEGHAVATEALDKIIKEAERRGFFAA
jgi:hypothetical protein